MPNLPDFAALFAASPYPYLLVDTDLVIIGANPAYLQATGRTPDIVGRPIFEAFPADPSDPGSVNLEEVRASIALAISTKRPHTSALLRYAVARETPDGTVFDARYWSAVHTPVFDAAGNVTFVSQNAIDVTDLYRFDASTRTFYLKQDANAVPDIPAMNVPQLHEAMTRILNAERGALQQLFDQAPGFIAILNGPDHVFDIVNESFYQLIGHRDILGKPVMQALQDLAGQGVDVLLDRAYASGEPIVLREHGIALQRHPDGAPEERYIDLLLQPIVDVNGRVTGIFAQGNDVTGAYLAHAALRAERDQSQYIFDSMDEGFAVLDRNWTILRMNAEGLRLTQARSADVIGRNHWEVWPELNGTDAERAYRRVMATGKTETVELAHLLPDGSDAWMEIRTHRSLDGGIAFFFRDITARRLAQEQLTLADRRKDEFLAMLAHELRNPLAPIGAAADLLQIARFDEARVRQTSEIIGRQVRHMTSLVDDLLDVSRVTRGLVELKREWLDVRDIVGEAVEQVSPLMQARHHHLDLAPAAAPRIMGDRKRLVQVLANLLTNAAKYTHDGGRITLATEVRTGHILLHVTDNGIGMTPELAARAFELFTQADRSSDRSLGGLGLGLALVKSLVDLHHGTVACSSAGPGAGSTFTVCLPRAAEDQDAADSAAGIQAPAPAAARKLQIMVVDDNVDAAAMLAMLLESYGHDVETEHGARGALHRAAATWPDVFLLDIGLPEIDGIELATRLRACPVGAQAVLVAITGYGQEQDRARTAAAGFDHHLVKPVDMPKLQAILAAADKKTA